MYRRPLNRAVAIFLACIILMPAAPANAFWGRKKKRPRVLSQQPVVTQPSPTPAPILFPQPLNPLIPTTQGYPPQPPMPMTPNSIAMLVATTASGSSPLIKIGNTMIEPSALNHIYSLRGYQPMFVNESGPNAGALELKEILTKQAQYKGLNPERYWTRDIESRWYARDARSIAELELLLTSGYVRFASDLVIGQVDPKFIDKRYIDSTHTQDRPTLQRKTFTDYALLSQFASRGNILASLEAIEPQHDQYKKLLQLLANLIAQKERGEWPKLAGSQVPVRVGELSPDVPLLRARLIDLHLLPDTFDRTSLVYDPAMQAAVIQFQKLYKASPDGILGSEVTNALNVSINDRIKQVQANLEKWRWMPANLGPQYIQVNIGVQELRVVENGQTVLEMDVVNGKQLRPTTIFIDYIADVVLNPYWSPPDSIVLQDIMPAQRADKNHMAHEHLRIFRDPTPAELAVAPNTTGVEVDPQTVNWVQYQNVVPPYYFRQDAGDFNSLGNVKFNLATNPHAIYLHDTAHNEEHQSLFKQNTRLFSSGCIRLSRPLDLLYYVMRGSPQWTPDALNNTMAHPETFPALPAVLPKSIPVYIMYLTTFVNDDGSVRFTPDYYGIDTRLIDALTPVNAQ